jgi:3',5'-cyclic AMP phosphodiesterase CpdA
MVRVAHLSDIHFGMQNAAAIDAVAAWLSREQMDLTVVSGDLTSFGAPSEFAEAAGWIGALPGPRLVAPGNHDTPYVGLWTRFTEPFAGYEASFGAADGVGWENPALSVVGINTARGVQLRLNWSKGAIAEAQSDAALAQLSGRPSGALGVVVCHHPLAEMVGGPMTGRVRGGEHAARRFCDAGVDLILTGHIHAPFAMALPHGDGRTYAVGAGTLSTRERGAPAGFNLIEADADAIRVTAMAWSGAALAVWREWVLPRRTQAPRASALTLPGEG